MTQRQSFILRCRWFQKLPKGNHTIKITATQTSLVRSGRKRMFKISVYVRLSSHLYVSIKQVESCGTDFHITWYWGDTLTVALPLQHSTQSKRSKQRLCMDLYTRSRTHFYRISLHIYRSKNFKKTFFDKNLTHFFCSKYFSASLIAFKIIKQKRKNKLILHYFHRALLLHIFRYQQMHLYTYISQDWEMYIYTHLSCVCVCACVYIYIYIYIYTSLNILPCAILPHRQTLVYPFSW
jgi:hypothetical protein